MRLAPVEESRIIRKPSRFRRWLIALIREALDERLHVMSEQLAFLVTKANERDARVAEFTAKIQEAKKPQRPRTWKEAQERLEKAAEGNG